MELDKAPTFPAEPASEPPSAPPSAAVTMAHTEVEAPKEPTSVVANAEKELDELATGEAADGLRRQQLKCRAEEKEAREAAKEESQRAKEEAKTKAAAKPKAKGRPRKTETEPEEQKPKKTKGATAAATEPTAASEQPARKRPAAKAEGGRTKRSKALFEAVTWDGPDVNQDLLLELKGVMTKFKDTAYDKEGMTLHTRTFS